MIVKEEEDLPLEPKCGTWLEILKEVLYINFSGRCRRVQRTKADDETIFPTKAGTDGWLTWERNWEDLWN